MLSLAMLLLGALAGWGWVAGLGKRISRRQPVLARAQHPAANEPVLTPVLPTAPPAAAPPPHLALTLMPLRFSVTLTTTALRYRLIIANHTGESLGPLAVTGVMMPASADDAASRNRAIARAPLGHLHTIASLPPGDTAELTGELKLPLSAASAIALGAARLMVPLVRLRIAHADNTLAEGLFIIGERRAGQSALTPFRLDLAPRAWQDIATLGIAPPALNDAAPATPSPPAIPLTNPDPAVSPALDLAGLPR